MPGIDNIKVNQDENSVDNDHVQAICCQILEEVRCFGLALLKPKFDFLGFSI